MTKKEILQIAEMINEAVPQAVGTSIEKHVNGGIRKLQSEVAEMKQGLADHAKSDTAYQGQDQEWKKRAEPMINIFEKNEIVSLEFKSRTKTLYFYSKAILTVAGVLTLAWTIFKSLK